MHLTYVLLFSSIYFYAAKKAEREDRIHVECSLPSLFYSTYRRDGVNRYDGSLPLSMYIVREGKAKLSPAALNCESISKLTSVWVPKMSADLRMK